MNFPQPMRKNLQPLLSALMLALGWLLPTSGFAQSVDMDLVKSRIRQNLSSGLLSVATIQGYQSTLQTDGTWADIDYNSTAQTNWPPRLHLERIRAMSKTYVWGSLQDDADLRNAILKAYDAWITKDPKSTNWWYQGISTPQVLGEILIILGNEVSTTRLNSGLTLVARSYVARATNSGTNTGANRVDRAYASIMRGLLANDSALTSESFLSMGDTILLNSANAFAEGIQADGSFQQHGAQLYVGGYGYGYLSGLLKYSGWGAGTAYGFSPLQKRVLLDHLLDGPQWFIRGNTMEYTSTGRGLSRAGSTSSALGFGTVVNDAIATSGGYRSAELTAFQQRMTATSSAGAAVPSSALVGNRNFWRADAMVHHRPGFSISVKTSSTRTLQPESGNGEGLKNLHLGDGVTLIQRTGNEYDDLMPVWDWRRLPGTTVEQGTYSLKPSADWGVAGTSTHAGGASDGQDGIAVFNYSRLAVAAKKSWFFFGDVMVALGSAIHAPAATHPVLTTLNQSQLSGAITCGSDSGASTVTSPVTPTGLKWVHHDKTGYFFPGSTSLATVSGATQTGTWLSINTAQGSATVSKSVFSLHLNHGTAVSNGSYSYLVAPGVESTAMDSFPVSNFQILRNDATVQAVKDAAANKTQASFWAAGTVDGITSDNKATVILKKDASFLDLAVSDPTQTNTTSILIELASPVAGVIRTDTGMSVEQTSPTLRVRISTAKSYGRTFKARFFLRDHAFRTLAIFPSADAFVFDGAPTTNYGTNIALACKLITTSSSYTRESYLSFPLTAGIPSPIAAELRMTPTSVQTAGIHAVQAVQDGTWSENEITWSNRPAPLNAAAATWLPALSSRTSCNVLPALSETSTGHLNLCVTTQAPTSDGYVAYASREHADPSLRPTLELIVPRSEMEIWKIEQLGSQAEDPSISQESADPDGDGESNLLEFATAQSPLNRTPTATQISLSSVGDVLTFTYPRSNSAVADGIQFLIEWSDSLLQQSWSHEGITEQVSHDDGVRQIVSARLPAGSSSKRFVRLRVTQP